MRHRRIPWALLLSMSSVSLAACGRDQDAPPASDESSTGGGEESTGGGENSATTGASATASTTMGTGADTTDGGGSDTGVDCEGPDGCYGCAPTTPTQVLNACTDATGEPFPNTPERLPLLEADGALPPIP